jgi:hypothetical protein
MSYMDLYYNYCVIETLRYEFRIKININILKMVILLLVYSIFVSFGHILTRKIIKIHKEKNSK